MTVVQSQIEVLAGIPQLDVCERVASTLLKPLLKHGLRVSEGPTITAETGLSPLNDFMVERPNFTARGRMKVEAMFSWATRQVPGIPSLGSLATISKVGTVSEAAQLSAMIETMKELSAPIAYLDVRHTDALRNRRNHHRTVFQGQKSKGEDKRFGIYRGLSGIGWRTLIGPDLVDHFGEDALSSLPASLAQKVARSIWLLTPSESPQDWLSNEWCAGEREIIQTLGVEKFFDPATGALPSAMPNIRPLSPHPVKLLAPDATSTKGPFLNYNGYVEG